MDIKVKISQRLRADIERIALCSIGEQVSETDFSNIQKKASFRDAKYNIEYLASAIEIDSVVNFKAYILWLRDILRTYDIEDIMLINHLKRITDYVVSNYPNEYWATIEHFISEGMSSILHDKIGIISHLDNNDKHALLARDYFNALLEMNKNKAIKIVLEVVEKNEISIIDLYLNVFTLVLYEIGQYWATRKITVGHEHFATAVTDYTMSLLYDKIFNNDEKKHKMIGVCVGDELHEIGIRMVCDIFELNHWDTYYLGANVPNESVLNEIKKIKPDILAISATLANKVPACIELIDIIKRECSRVKIIVGGLPFNIDKNLWKFVDADGYSADANEAVRIASLLIGEKHE